MTLVATIDLTPREMAVMIKHVPQHREGHTLLLVPPIKI